MNKKRLLAIAMIVLLIVGLLPLSTFAEGEALPNGDAVAESVKGEVATATVPAEDTKEEAPKTAVPTEDKKEEVPDTSVQDKAAKKEVPLAGGNGEETKEATSDGSATVKETEKTLAEEKEIAPAEGETNKTGSAADSKTGNAADSKNGDSADANKDDAPEKTDEKDDDKDEGKDEENSSAFSQSRTASGVTVTVAAETGVFPEDATLSVASASSQATAAAIAPKRESDANVAASYTFDIKVLDKEGEELQPEDGKTVQVSFRAAEVADPNLDVSVYHISGGKADELAVSEAGSTATTKTTGFSYYTVEFTYGDLQYVLNGGGKVPLADILQAVGLFGVPTDVQVSKPELFSAYNKNGAWYVQSYQPFSTDEWMRVTIGGKTYDIAVTDAQRQIEIDGVVYSYDTESSEATVTGYTSALSADVTIRATITVEGVAYRVTGVAASAFLECASLTSVSIPHNVSIGKRAFRACGNLASVSFTGYVATIGSEAFTNCDSLTSVSFQRDVGSIEEKAFYSCDSLTSMSFQGYVESIGEKAFYNCASLTSVSFGKKVISIGIEAFYNCKSLTSVSFPYEIVTVGDRAFRGCGNLTSVSFGDYAGSIGIEAFKGCKNLAGVNFGGNVKSIGESAFASCDSLASVSFLGNVKSIGEKAFYKCDSLTSMSFPCDVESIGESAFAGCASLASVSFLGKVESIGGSAFAICKSLASVSLPHNVNIGERAFRSCASLTSVSFGGQVGSIGTDAFYNCDSLVNVSFPDNVESIGEMAFRSCSSLTSVSFLGNVKSIGKNAFRGCVAFADVYYSGTEAQWRAVTLGGSWNQNDGVEVHCKYGVAANPADGGTVEGEAIIVYGADGKPDTTKPVITTVKAIPNKGYEFVNWTSDAGITFADATAPETTLTTTEPSATAIANFRDALVISYDVTVVDGEADKDKAAEGETVAITADDPPSGKFFKCWKSDDIGADDFDDATAPETTFTMPGEAVTVEAVYGKVLIGPAGGTTSDPIPDQVYTGKAIEPELKVALEDVDSELVEGTDYDVEYTDNIYAGTATAIVTLKGNWKGSGSISFEITKRALTVTADSDTQVYNGKALVANGFSCLGLVGGDSIESVTVVGSQTDVGESENIPSDAKIVNSESEDVTSCYSINYTNGKLVVIPKAVTVTADNSSKYFGSADPEFTAQASGLIDSDTIAYSVT